MRHFIMLSLSQVKSNPFVQEYLYQTELALKALGYTEHGKRHAEVVSGRARFIAKAIGMSEKEQELAAIAGYLHDFANFLGRTHHHYWGAILTSQIFGKDFSPRSLSLIIQAIANHDKFEMKFSNKISAVLVLADKSDVHYTRVRKGQISRIQADIHDRVNFATKETNIKVEKSKKTIKLVLKINTSICPIMEYFEIFTTRMAYCREAASYLGYKFTLIINNFKLL